MVEYVLLVTAVLIVCIYFYTYGPMGTDVNAGLNGMITEIQNLNSQINLAPIN